MCIGADTEQRDLAMALEEGGRMERLVNLQLDSQSTRMPGQSARERAEVLASRAARFRREGDMPVSYLACISQVLMP